MLSIRHATFVARYHGIVPDQRIVTTYEMYLDEKRISVSLATLEFKPDGAGTRISTSRKITGRVDPAGSRSTYK